MKKKRAGKGRKSWQRMRGWLVATVVVLSVAAYAFIQRQTPSPEPRGTIQRPVSPTKSAAVPPYHESAQAAMPFPSLVPARNFRRNPPVARAYQIAAEIPGVIAQQPCYCYCDKSGHRSLLDCYASDHGARCLICIKEVLLAKQMTRRGITPVAIREAIIRGEWRNVDVVSAIR